MNFTESLLRNSEKKDSIIRAAAAFVPVDDYCQIRSKQQIDISERLLIIEAQDKIHEWIQIHDQKSPSGKKPEQQFDIRAVASRQIIKGVPLEQYLACRKEAIISGIVSNSHLVANLEESIGQKDQLETALLKGENLSRQLDLTNSVIKTTSLSFN